MVSAEELKTYAKVTWCPGCGNFGIYASLRRALSELELAPGMVALVSGIGCHAKIVDYVNTNSFYVIHGRVLPVATAIKLANHKLTVIGHAGDGDGYGIGIGHLSHTCRRNINITYIVHNNMVYGLTTGQTAPTSQQGYVSKTSPYGELALPINPIAHALASDATMVARGFAGDPKHLTELIKECIRHKGFALLDVLQPCVTFNRINTYDFYRKRVYKLEEEKYDYTDRMKAYDKSYEWGDKIPIGTFYKVERPAYHEGLPQIAKTPLSRQKIEDVDISDLMNSFT